MPNILPGTFHLGKNRRSLLYRETNLEVDAAGLVHTPVQDSKWDGISVGGADIIERGGAEAWNVYVQSNKNGTAFIYGYDASGTVVIGTVASGTVGPGTVWQEVVEAIQNYPRLGFSLINGGSAAVVTIEVTAQ